MSTLLLILISSFSAFFFFFFVFGFRKSRKTGSVTYQPIKGSLGYPVIGETLSFLRAQEKNEGHDWIDERVSKHGHVFKTHLMGSPTVVIVGQAANKFLFTAPDDILASKQPVTISAIAGKDNIFELTGSRYKAVKAAMMNFLKPETLTNYTGQMDRIVKRLIAEEVAKQSDDYTVKAVSLMKTLTFHVACDILFAIQDQPTKQALIDDFTIAFQAVWSLPLNFPGTTFWKGLRARSRIVERIRPIVKERREEVESGRRGATSDVVSCLVGLREEGGEAIGEDSIMDHFITLMIASHDTSAILASLMLWRLSRDQDIYSKVFQEQMEIKKVMIERSKQANGDPENLIWADIQKMKYTWRVAQELMRLVPPVFGSFRKALRDTTFGNHRIPKGWQIYWAACGTHLKDDIFENPNEFDPMRFENSSKVVPPYTYVAFGGGARTCIGNEFARVEILTIIHNMVTTYEWSQVNPDEVITRKPMPYPSLGLPIKIKSMATSL